MKRLSILVLAALACFALVATVTGLWGGSDSNESVAAGVQTSAPVTKVDPQLTGAFTVFRRDAQSDDIPPAPEVGRDDVARGANRALARRAFTRDNGESIYLIPTRGGVCMESSHYLAHGCWTTEAALAGDHVDAVICSPYLDMSRIQLSGVLPDDAQNVHLQTEDGSTTPVSVRGNAWVAEPLKQDPLPVTLEWETSGGHHSAPTTNVTEARNENCGQLESPTDALAHLKEQVGDGSN